MTPLATMLASFVMAADLLFIGIVLGSFIEQRWPGWLNR